MIKNYFKVAWRNLRRNSLYSLINIGGLAIGIKQIDRLREWIDVVVTRSRRFVVDHRLHVERDIRMEHLGANLDLGEDIEETVRGAGGSERRHVKNTGG